jgi:hypothetical protein
MPEQHQRGDRTKAILEGKGKLFLGQGETFGRWEGGGVESYG